MKFHQLSSTDFSILREYLKSGFPSDKLLKLQEKRIEATEKEARRLLDQYPEGSEIYKKLDKPIAHSEYRWLVWPMLVGDNKTTLFQIIIQGVRDPSIESYFVENDDGKLIGYCGYQLRNGKPENIHLFSWEKGLTRFDAFTMFNNLLSKYGEIEWFCIKGNPFEPVYDDYIKNKKLNGCKVQKRDMEKVDETLNPLDPKYCPKEPIFRYKVVKGNED